MKCQDCMKKMEHHDKLEFNGHQIAGWRCSCGQIYYEPEEAGKILLLNKLRKKAVKAKLGRIRSNLIIRVPKDIETVFNLQKGKDVRIEVDSKGFRVEF